MVTHALVPYIGMINLTILICVLHDAAPRGEGMEDRGEGVDMEERLDGYPDFGILRNKKMSDVRDRLAGDLHITKQALSLIYHKRG